MLPWTPFYQIVLTYSTRRIWYVSQVEKMSLKILTQTRSQLMCCSTTNMTMGARTPILLMRAKRGKMKTVVALKHKSCCHPSQSRCHSCSTPGNTCHCPAARRMWRMVGKASCWSKRLRTASEVAPCPLLPILMLMCLDE